MYQRIAHIKIDASESNKHRLLMLEMVLFGTAITDPRLPSPEEVINIMTDHDDNWLGGFFPFFDEVSFPYNGLYEKVIIGVFPKIDERRF